MSKPPLWEVLERARDAVIAAHHPFAREEQCLAAEIRALRDWLVPEESIEDAPGRFVNGCCFEDHQRLRALLTRQRLRALLTAEADRAERGEQL